MMGKSVWVEALLCKIDCMKESLSVHHESVVSKEQFEHEIFPTLEKPVAIRRLDGAERQYAKELFREYGFQFRSAIAGLRSEMEDWIVEADVSGSLNRDDLQEKLDDIMTDISDLQWAQHPYFRSKLSDIDRISDQLIAQFFRRYYKILSVVEHDSDTILKKVIKNSDDYLDDMAEVVEITHTPFAVNLNFNSRESFLRFLGKGLEDTSTIGMFYISGDDIPVTVEVNSEAFEHEQDHAVNRAFGLLYTEHSVSNSETQKHISDILRLAKDEILVQYLDGDPYQTIRSLIVEGSYFVRYTEGCTPVEKKQYQNIVARAIDALFQENLQIEPSRLVEQLFVSPIARWADEIERLESVKDTDVIPSKGDWDFSKAA